MLRRHSGFILVCLALISLGLGMWGFLSVDAAIPPATALYRSMQLFYWNYFPWNAASEATLPWSLELARWLAPITTLGALSQVAIALFQQRWDAFRARRSRGHVVICGAGEKGAVLGREINKRREKIVFIEKDTDRAERLASEGALVIHGDATCEEALRQAAVPHASRLVAATGNDHHNLAIAMMARQSGIGSIHAHSSDASLCDLYRRHSALTSSQTGTGEIRMFNSFRNMARCTLQEFPPESDAAHVILPDLSDASLALAREYALMGHFLDGNKIHFHIVSPEASQELAALKMHYPGIEQCANVDAISLSSSKMFSREISDLVAKFPAGFTIFPGLDDGEVAFSRALELLELTRGNKRVRLLLPASEHSPMRLIVKRNPEMRARVGFLPSLEKTCGYEAVIGESLDRIARKIHESWLQETQRQILRARAAGDEPLAFRHETKETFKAWEQLSEEQKGANRSQADHIPFKIRAAGLDPKTVTKDLWSQLAAEQVERLARMEHARWAAYYWMNGWTFSLTRDDEKKEHPNLVPYDQLDEPTKDYDRAVVVNLRDYLADDQGRLP